MVLEFPDNSNQSRVIKPRSALDASKSPIFGDISSISGSAMPNALDFVLSTQTYELNDLTEAIVFWAEEQLGLDEFVTAKNEFYNLMGKVFPDEPYYHQRVSYFLDYFIFQRFIQGDLRGHDRSLTPYNSFIRSDYLNDKKVSKSLREDFLSLEKFKHSLFQILKIKSHSLVIVDLLKNEKFEAYLSGNSLLKGFDKNTSFQGFLFFINNKFYLPKGLILHPSQALSVIKKIIKKAIKNTEYEPLSLLSLFSKLNLAYIRHNCAVSKTIYKSGLDKV